MASKVDLINGALRKIAGSPVVSPNEETPEAYHAGAAFDAVRDTVLSDYPFAFAMKLGRLAQVAEAPAFGFAKAFQLPVDLLYLLDVRGSGSMTEKPVAHSIVGNEVHTDEAECCVRYITRHDNTAFWPPHFCRAFETLLAAELAPIFGAGTTAGAKLREEYSMLLEEAAAQDARQQNAPAIAWEPQAMTAREG